MFQPSVGPLDYTVEIKGSTRWKVRIDHLMERDSDNKSAHSLVKSVPVEKQDEDSVKNPSDSNVRQTSYYIRST